MGLQCRRSIFSGCCLIFAERDSRICTSMFSTGILLISSDTIMGNMPDGEPTACIKFTNLHMISRQRLRQQICRKMLFASIQSDPDQNQEWLGGHRYKVMRQIRNHKLFISPLRMGHVLWLLTPSCQWIYNHIWSRNMWCIQHPQTTKSLRVEWNLTHIMRARTLYWQFCWYLVHSKPTTYRHYKLLRTRTWSHRQLKLISWQLRKKYKINWLRLWTRSCCQSKREESRFQSWIASE